MASRGRGQRISARDALGQSCARKAEQEFLKVGGFFDERPGTGPPRGEAQGPRYVPGLVQCYSCPSSECMHLTRRAATCFEPYRGPKSPMLSGVQTVGSATPGCPRASLEERMDGIIHDSRPGFSILPTRSEVPSCCWSMAQWACQLFASLVRGPFSGNGTFWHTQQPVVPVGRRD